MDDITKTLLEITNLSSSKKGQRIKDNIGDYTVGTIYAGDLKKGATAIKKSEGQWVVVEKYYDIETIEEKHKYWCEICEGKPIEVISADNGEIVEL